MGHDCSMNALQEVKELVRGTRQAVGSNFLGSLESFLVYLESLMDYCKMFLADSAAEAVMKVWGRHGGRLLVWGPVSQESPVRQAPCFLHGVSVRRKNPQSVCGGHRSRRCHVVRAHAGPVFWGHADLGQLVFVTTACSICEAVL